MIFTATCPSCGYRATDVMVLGEKPATRCEWAVASAEDIKAVVIRSSFGTIEIPELGVTVEPRRGEAFITTVEGVLTRVERVAKLLSRDSEGKKRAEAVLKQIEQIKLGKEPMTLIITDPTGNSAIIADQLFFDRESFTEDG